MPKDNLAGAKAKFLSSLVRVHDLVIKLRIGNVIPLSLNHSENRYNIEIINNNFIVNEKLMLAKMGINAAQT